EIAALGKSCATRAEHRPLCLLAGGETTVTLKGSGTGGRNQELALSAAIELNSTKNCVFLAAGTDGTDGHTEAAGALVDDQTLARAHKLGLEVNDFLDRNDSYNFFKKTGDLIVTGPTGTNVMDVVLCLLE
ncbi:glycerate dehydrogenase, partial [bacterium]|nr:glycerate dehydrogenase [bacterium]